jgi:hypothetical protein
LISGYEDPRINVVSARIVQTTTKSTSSNAQPRPQAQQRQLLGRLQNSVVA